MRPARVTEEPFEEEYRASLERQAGGGRRPRSFGQFLEWMRALWHAEMPIDMQAPGVFRGYADRPGAKERYALWARLSSPAQLAGGSLLGSPRDKDPFRRLMEESPFEVEFASYDGQTQPDPHYRRPLRAALARLSFSRPIAARWLTALAYSDFDYRGLAARRGWDTEEAELFLIQALYLLWREFDTTPRSLSHRVDSRPNRMP